MTTALGTLTVKLAMALAAVFIVALGVAGASGTLGGHGHTGITNQPLGVASTNGVYDQAAAPGGYASTPTPAPARDLTRCPTGSGQFDYVPCFGTRVPAVSGTAEPAPPATPSVTPAPTTVPPSGWWCCSMDSWDHGATGRHTSTSPDTWGGMMQMR